MIHIRKSPTADTRSCDFAAVTKEELAASSRQHISDVQAAISLFINMLTKASMNHDCDKLSFLDWFHSDFVTGFKETGWWDNHRKISRHHLAQEDGVPADVNLVDILEYVADCVMAGMARTGEVYSLHMPQELLMRAFNNTVELLINNVTVIPDAEVESYPEPVAEIQTEPENVQISIGFTSRDELLERLCQKVFGASPVYPEAICNGASERHTPITDESDRIIPGESAYEHSVRKSITMADLEYRLADMKKYLSAARRKLTRVNVELAAARRQRDRFEKALIRIGYEDGIAIPTATQEGAIARVALKRGERAEVKAELEDHLEAFKQIYEMVPGESDDPDRDIARMQDIAADILRRHDLI